MDAPTPPLLQTDSGAASVSRADPIATSSGTAGEGVVDLHECLTAEPDAASSANARDTSSAKTSAASGLLKPITTASATFATTPAISLDMQHAPAAVLHEQRAEEAQVAAQRLEAAGDERVDDLEATEGAIIDMHEGDDLLNPDEPTSSAVASGSATPVAEPSPTAADHAPIASTSASLTAATADISMSPGGAPAQEQFSKAVGEENGSVAALDGSGLDSTFASPMLRETTPSEAASDATSAVGPAVAATNVPPEASSAHSELAHPLSAYPFANTTLVPADSTSTKPFFYTNFPPTELPVSWTRSKRGDDPEADIPLDREAGYFASGKELTESRKLEAARMTKVRARLAEMGLAPDGTVIPAPVEPVEVPARRGRGRGRGRGGSTRGGSRSREASSGVDGAAPTGRRGRPPKASALREVQADEVDQLEEMDLDGPRPSRTKAKKVAPPRSPSPAPAPPPPPPPPAVLKVDLALTLLQDDLQTSTPIFLEPHPAFIDHLDLPPYYLPAGVDLDSLPAVTKPNRIVAARLASEAAALAAEALAAATPLVADKSGSGDVAMADGDEQDAEMQSINGGEAIPAVSSDATPAPALSASQSASATPMTTEDFERDASAVPDEESSSGRRPNRASKTLVGIPPIPANKRARQTDDDGPKPSKRKKARESTVGSEASDEPPLGPPVEYVLQSTTCLSKKVEGQVRCWQCIARSIGHGCSFMGIRSFGVDYLGRIVTPPVFRSSDEADEIPNLDKPYTSPMTKMQSTLLKTWLARDVVKLFDREWRHATDHNTIKVRNDLVMHSTCDTCNTVCVGAEWICKTCGRTACPLCFERLKQFEATESSGGTVPVTADNQRRRKCIAKKRGKDQTGGESHRPLQFVPVTRLDASKLERMRQVARNWHSGHKLQASDPKVLQYIMDKFCLKSNLKDYDADTHRVWTIAHKTFDEPFFFEVWRRGEPILVRRCPPGALDKFTPEYFVEQWGDQKVDVVNNRSPDKVEKWDVRDFFGKLQTADGKRRDDADQKDKASFRIDEWPQPAQWAKDYKSLKDAFLSFLPLPNLFHPDGVLNCIGHTPGNAAQPQRGPRLMASWDTDAATPTIKLQTSNTDIASYMFWGGRDPVTGKTLRIRWDVFREEDVPKLRDFCYDLLHSQQPKGTSNAKFRDLHDDPLLSPTMYLTKKQRAALFKRSGVKPYPVYQYMGDLVLIPAGCPYQVSSWIDHMNLSISFLAGSRVGAAIKTTIAYQNATRERTLWYRDLIQLETQLYYTWMSCDAFDRAGKIGLKTVRGKLNWPFPKDEKNRPIVPREETKRLAQLAEVEKRGTEISAKLKTEATKKFNDPKEAVQPKPAPAAPKRVPIARRGWQELEQSAPQLQELEQPAPQPQELEQLAPQPPAPAESSNPLPPPSAALFPVPTGPLGSASSMQAAPVVPAAPPTATAPAPPVIPAAAIDSTPTAQATLPVQWTPHDALSTAPAPLESVVAAGHAGAPAAPVAFPVGAAPEGLLVNSATNGGTAAPQP